MFQGFAFFNFFFFNDTATTEIYTLSLHDALPISVLTGWGLETTGRNTTGREERRVCHRGQRSEEHTSELQSQSNLVCRLLLEKKNAWDTRCALCAAMYWNDTIS